MATIKPIVGTWFLLFWDYNPTGRCQDIRYDHWEPVVRNYTEAHWDAFMEDLASIGQKYLVLVYLMACNTKMCLKILKCQWTTLYLPKHQLIIIYLF